MVLSFFCALTYRRRRIEQSVRFVGLIRIMNIACKSRRNVWGWFCCVAADRLHRASYSPGCVHENPRFPGLHATKQDSRQNEHRVTVELAL